MRSTASFLLATLLLAAYPLRAQEQSHSLQSGDLTVHYNAVPTTALSAEVAREYGITRSSGRALLNVAVRRDAGNDVYRAIAASVQAAATNLNGQRQDLDVREVREGDAIYYLAEARFQDSETLRFDLQVLPEGAAEALQARFEQQFFAH